MRRHSQVSSKWRKNACGSASWVSQLIADKNISIDEDKVRQHVEEMCAAYENAEDMVELYLGNPQLVQQVQPMVLEQQAIDWLMENGNTTTKKVAFSEYMNS